MMLVPEWKRGNHRRPNTFSQYSESTTLQKRNATKTFELKQTSESIQLSKLLSKCRFAREWVTVVWERKPTSALAHIVLSTTIIIISESIRFFFVGNGNNLTFIIVIVIFSCHCYCYCYCYYYYYYYNRSRCGRIWLQWKELGMPIRTVAHRERCRVSCWYLYF